MELYELRDSIENFYQAATVSQDMVLTVVNPDGTVTGYEIDGATVLDTGHPNGSGERVYNLVIFPKK